MKTIGIGLIIIGVLAFCLQLTGCGLIYGPVKEVEALINEKDEVLLLMGRKIGADPTEAGVNEARKIFEERKGGLKAKSEAIKDKSKGISGDWLTNLMESEVHDNEMLNLMRKELGASEAAGKTFSELRKDFEDAVRR